MAKFRVWYEGFAYVEADSAEEAKELFWNDADTYSEETVTGVEEVWDFDVDL